MTAVTSGLNGAVPPGWAIKKLKHVAFLQSGDTISPEAITDAGEFPVFGGNGFRGFTSDFTHEGDFVLIGRQGALCGNVNYASGRFWASEHAVVADTHGKADIRWLGELLRSMNLNQYSQSAAQPGLAVDVIANLPVPVPPLHSQTAISRFLVDHTTAIDQLVAAKEKLLELLAEKRRAMISHAVTLGVDPNVRLRDSGVSWLGRIPAHWKVERCAWLFRERDNRAEPELPLLEVSINSGVTLRQFSTDQIESTAADFNSYKVARARDLAFNKMRMWQGAVGIAPVDGLVSPDYTVAEVSEELSTDFVSYLMRTEQFSAECCRESHGITWDRLRLYWDGFREIRIPVPPLDEQESIVAWIELKAGRAEALRAKTSRTIELLKERRAALISAAVTGQLDVGGKVAS